MVVVVAVVLLAAGVLSPLVVAWADAAATRAYQSVYPGFLGRCERQFLVVRHWLNSSGNWQRNLQCSCSVSQLPMLRYYAFNVMPMRMRIAMRALPPLTQFNEYINLHL